VIDTVAVIALVIGNDTVFVIDILNEPGMRRLGTGH